MSVSPLVRRSVIDRCRSSTFDILPDVVLFDLDGVLADSGKSIRRAWMTWARSVGLPWPVLAPHIPGRKAVDTIRLAVPAADQTWIEASATQVNLLQIHDEADTAVFAGMSDFYRSLPPQRVALVTSAPRQLALARLRRRDLPIPRVLFGAEDVVVGKPDPEGWSRALRAHEALGADCLAIEDAPVGVASAAAAGLQVVALTTTHAPAMLREADWVVRDGRQLTADMCKGSLVVRITDRNSGPTSGRESSRM